MHIWICVCMYIIYIYTCVCVCLSVCARKILCSCLYVHARFCDFKYINISLKQTKAGFATGQIHHLETAMFFSMFQVESGSVYWLQYHWTSSAAAASLTSDPCCDKLGMLSNWQVSRILRHFSGCSGWRLHQPRMPVPPRSAQKTWDFWPARWCFQRLLPMEKLSPSCHLPMQWPQNNHTRCRVFSSNSHLELRIWL